MRLGTVAKVFFVVIIFLFCVNGFSQPFTFYLTNGLIDIFLFSDTLGGKLSYDPYKAKITITFGTNVLEFFENREFFIVNSNFVFPMIGGLVRTNYNYYLKLSTVDSIVSFFRIECRILNYTSNAQSNIQNLDYTNKIPSTNVITNTSELKINVDSSQQAYQGDTNFIPIKFVIIDAGHGGKDPGAIHNGVKEKELNLKYAKSLSSELVRLLSSKGYKVDVILSRSDDIYLTLEQRVKIANELLKKTRGYGIFVSIHKNASPIKGKKGMEIYFVSDQAVDDNSREVVAFENSFIPKEEIRKVSELEKVIGKIRSVALMEESRILANNLEKNMNGLGFSPIIKGAPFYVIKYIPVPSVLVEVGYISNPEEVKLLSSPSYISEVSKSLARGILDFIDEYNQTKGFTVVK